MNNKIFRDNDKDMFIKMFPEFIGTVLTLAERKHIVTIKVLMFLVRNMNSTNEVHRIQGLICSQPVMAGLLSTTQCNISKSINELVKMNAIKVYKSGPSSVYVINSNLVWQNVKDTDAKFSKFGVNIIISNKEQHEVYQQRKKHGKSDRIKSVPEKVEESVDHLV